MSRSSGAHKNPSQEQLWELHVETGYDLNTKKVFEDNPVRIAVLTVGFDPKSMYGIIKTAFNPDAAKVLRSHYPVASEGMGFHATLQRVCDIYMDALSHGVKKAGIRHASYPMVVNDQVHNLDRHVDQPFWPSAHLIKGESQDIRVFMDIVSCLNGDDSYRFIEQRQAPQNYHMPDVDLIRDSAVNPLLVEKDSIFLSGDELKRMVDFLCPYRYSHRSKPQGISQY